MRAKLKALREANGYTQQTLSDAIGMSRSHYSQVESGDKQPSLKLACLLYTSPSPRDCS